MGGEIDMLRQDPQATSTATVVAVGEDVKCFCLSCDELTSHLDREEKLKGAVQGLLAESILQKVLALNEKRNLLEYGAVLELAHGLRCNSGLTAVLDDFRQRHSISGEVLRHMAEQQSEEGTEQTFTTKIAEIKQKMS